MAFIERQTKRPQTTAQAAVLALLAGMAFSSPVPLQPSAVMTTLSSPLPPQSSTSMTSEEPWLMTSEGSSRSHLMMWMMTKKQLIPRLHALVDSATALLRCTCGEEGKTGTEECLAFAASLPTIPDLSDVPSERVIQSEKTRTFVKTLLENGYSSLKQVETLLWSEVTPPALGQCASSHTARHFMGSLQTAASQYENMMTSFYKSKVSQACAVEVPREEFSSNRHLAIRLLEVAVNHLNQVSSALEYAVEFSWFSRMNMSFYAREKLWGRRKNRRLQNRQ